MSVEKSSSLIVPAISEPSPQKLHCCVDDERAPRLAHRGKHAVVIQRYESPKVDHLGANAMLSEFVSRRQALLNLPAICDQRDVATFSANLRDTKRDAVIVGRNLHFRAAKHVQRFEMDAGILVENAAEQEPFGIERVAPGTATLMPGVCSSQASSDCECCAPKPPMPPPTIILIVMGADVAAPDIYRCLAA